MQYAFNVNYIIYQNSNNLNSHTFRSISQFVLRKHVFEIKRDFKLKICDFCVNYRLTVLIEAVLTNTHNLYIRANIQKIMFTRV